MKGLPELVIGDLKVKRPVIQGGMGVGVSGCKGRRSRDHLNRTDRIS